jgi:hypothetical protein
MADLNKQGTERKKRVYRRKIKSASIDITDKDSERLTDDNGRLKFIKQSKYLKTLTQGEE